MKHPVKTLAALAILGAVAPSAHAMSIKDDVVSLKLKGNVQFRASLLNDASNTVGDEYDPLRGANGEAEAARFDIRRARIGFEAKLGDWMGNITLRSEKNDNAAAGGTGSNAGRQVQLYYANISRDFKVGDFNHQIRLGLDKSFHAESTQSSSTFLFPTDTIVDEKVEERGVGIGYRMTMPFINLGLDLHNNSTGAFDADAAADDKTNGMFYSVRIEVAPGADFMPAKRTHSFAGKEGTHLVVGLDAQWNMDVTTDNAAAATYNQDDFFTWGPDLLVHWNGLTALAEYRMRTRKRETQAGDAADLDSIYWDIQAGYAFPLDTVVIEPALGFMVNDGDADDDNEASVYGNGTDNGGSGTTLNIGVNFYWNGHDNKTQIAFQSWKAEDGDGDATIIRIQQQLNF